MKSWEFVSDPREVGPRRKVHRRKLGKLPLTVCNKTLRVPKKIPTAITIDPYGFPRNLLCRTCWWKVHQEPIKESTRKPPPRGFLPLSPPEQGKGRV